MGRFQTYVRSFDMRRHHIGALAWFCTTRRAHTQWSRLGTSRSRVHRLGIGECARAADTDVNAQPLVRRAVHHAPPSHLAKLSHSLTRARDRLALAWPGLECIGSASASVHERQTRTSVQ